MKTKLAIAAITALWALAGAAVAQSVWVQVEAKRSLSEAQDRVRDYARSLQNVNGFALRSGWYAIALGPFAPEMAETRLLRLRAEGRIPRDSFLADGSAFGRQFWPVGAAALEAPLLVPDSPAEETASPTPLIPAEETVAEARNGERMLSLQEREELQVALRWEGFYDGAIDGAFGPGTRSAMAAWQDANSYDATGVLTTKQRSAVVSGYREMLTSVGLSRRIDERAGIEIDLPTAMVEFDRYDPPFAHYSAKDGSGVKVLLISQTGDLTTLAGLYDILQTLSIVPLNGPRELGRSSFTLIGENADRYTYSYAELAGDDVKGFVLVWPAGEVRRRGLVIDTMRASFTPLAGSVLPDVVDGGTAQSRDLLAGLEIRRPDLLRSGFYVDDAGSVMTTTEAVDQCDRVTLDNEIEAGVAARDEALGLALLRPKTDLAPIRYARFQPRAPRLTSEIAVSGYSYEGQLGAPTLTFGRLEDLRGLEGEDGLTRLALATTTGDAGGPVFDGTGSVMGMLLPPARPGGRVLPEGVNFAADAEAIIRFLSDNGISAAASDSEASMAPEDLTAAAADMTVQVSCWK